jgi:hypothetical protein
VVPHRIPIPTVEKLLTRFVRETNPALFTSTATYHLPSPSTPTLTALCPSHMCISHGRRTHVYACNATPLKRILSIPTPPAHALALTGSYLATTVSRGKTTLRVLKPLLKLYSISIPDTTAVCLLPHTAHEEPLVVVLARTGLSIVHPEYAIFVARAQHLRIRAVNPWVIHVSAEIPDCGGGLRATGDGRGIVVAGTHVFGTFSSSPSSPGGDGGDAVAEVSTSSLWKHYSALPRNLRRLNGASELSHLRGESFIGRCSGVLALVGIDAPVPIRTFPVPEGASAITCGAHALAVITPGRVSILSTATGNKRTVYAAIGEVRAVHADARRVILVMKDRVVIVGLWGGRNGEWSIRGDGTLVEGFSTTSMMGGCCAVQ